MSETQTQASKSEQPEPSRDFIREIVAEDCNTGKWDGRVVTRFPPEPNGYLHIGHAKSICLNFGIAGEFAGACNLRFDDTNPAKKDLEYVEAIKEDVHWLGFEYAELRHASDYFEVFYRSALKLIEDGKAFVCDLSAEEVREYRSVRVCQGRAPVELVLFVVHAPVVGLLLPLEPRIQVRNCPVAVHLVPARDRCRRRQRVQGR